MGKDYERQRMIARSRSRSRSHSRSRSDSYRKRKSSESDRSYRRRRKSYSPSRKYKRKTSRDNSSENAGNTIYLSNLSKRIRDDEIREKFSKYGKLDHIHIVRDPFTKESRGFGFITYENSKDAREAIDKLNKTEIDGRQVTVELSKRNRPHKPTPGVYLGPTNNQNRERKRAYSPKKSYKRSRSRSRDRYRRSPYSRSRSGSYHRKK